jgi:adenine-specific DNA-methyltransferase
VEFSEKPIASIPFRTIDWLCEAEVLVHGAIVNASKKYIETTEDRYLDEINTLFIQLFQL